MHEKKIIVSQNVKKFYFINFKNRKFIIVYKFINAFDRSLFFLCLLFKIKS